MLNFDEIVNLTDAQMASDATGQPASASFASLLAQNAAYRQQQSKAWEKREKEAKSRKTWAAISDALSSLGNLVGTGFGAANQPQTYQMPFVVKDIEADRALARATAERLRANDQALLSSQAKQDAKGDPLALLDARHQNTMREIAARGAVNSALETQKQQGRETLKDMYYKYKGDYDKIQADLKRQGIQIQRERLDEAIRHNMAVEELREQYGGGNVGGYTTETTINRNEYGQETGRTTTRTPAPRPGVKDQPSTTTTTKKKANPMGASTQQEKGKKKKKNPMN